MSGLITKVRSLKLLSIKYVYRDVMAHSINLTDKMLVDKYFCNSEQPIGWNVLLAQMSLISECASVHPLYNNGVYSPSVKTLIAEEFLLYSVLL